MSESPAASLAAFLADRDAECPGCSYNLRGLHGGECPECGQRLELRVGLSDPRPAAFMTGAIGLSAGAGMAGLLLLYAVILAIRAGFFTGPMSFVWINLGALIVEGAALWVWLRIGRRLRRMGRAARWSLAAAGWGLTLLYLGVFTAIVR